MFIAHGGNICHRNLTHIFCNMKAACIHLMYTCILYILLQIIIPRNPYIVIHLLIIIYRTWSALPTHTISRCRLMSLNHVPRILSVKLGRNAAIGEKDRNVRKAWILHNTQVRIAYPIHRRRIFTENQPTTICWIELTSYINQAKTQGTPNLSFLSLY